MRWPTALILFPTFLPVQADAQDDPAALIERIRRSDAVGPLAAFLRHENEHVRDEAAAALVRIGKPSVPALLKLLDDATELPATLDESYTKRKYPELATSKSPLNWRQLGPGKLYAPAGLAVNRYAIRALGLIGDRGAVRALEETEKKFAGKGWIRDECRRARIALLGSETPLAPDMRPWMLAEIGNPAAASRLVASVARALRSNDGNNIAKKFGAYTDIGGGRPDDGIRRIDALGALGRSVDLKPLLRLVEKGVRDDWQWFHAGMHDLVDHYHGIGCGWDAHWMAPLAACRALGEAGARDAIPALKARLTDKNILVRLSAAGALARLGDPSGLQMALDDLRWMRPEFVSDYNRKGKPWLQHWINEDQSKLPNDRKPFRPGQTFYRPNPNYQYLAAYDALGRIGGEKAGAMLKERAKQILELKGTRFFSAFYQTDLLWIAASLKRLGEPDLAARALEGGIKLFEGGRATDNRLRHFHVAALPALARLNDPTTRDAVWRVLFHHQTTWRPGTYDLRDLAWGVYLTLEGRRDPDKPLRCSELCWLH